MALGGKVLEYIIKAKDATKAGIDSAKGGVQKLVVHVKDALGRANKAAKETADEAERTGRAVEKAAQRAGNETKTAAGVADEAVKRARDGMKQEAEQTKVLEILTNRLAEAKKRLANLKGSAAETAAAREVKALESAVGDLEQKAGTANQAVGLLFNAMHGNIEGVAKSVASLGGMFSGLAGPLALAGSAIGIIATAWKMSTEAVERYCAKLREAASAQWQRSVQGLARAVGDLGDKFARMNAEMERSASTQKSLDAARISSQKAAAEAARERELSGLSVHDEEGRAAINAKYDAQVRALERQLRDSQYAEDDNLAQQQRWNIEEEIGRLERARAGLADSIAAEKREVERLWSPDNETDRKAAEQRMADLRAQVEDIDKRIQAGKDEIAALNDRQDVLREERDAANDAEVAEAERRAREELDAQERAADELQAYYDQIYEEELRERERMIQEEERERERAAQERLRAELEAERKLHAQKVSDARAELQASQQAQQAAQGRLSAAKSQVSQAWGWYRDKDSMQAWIDDKVAQREAEKQFEKDFARLSRKRGWRDIEVGKLTAEEEATRQVALAKEEEAAAQKALDEIAENTRDLAEKLDELLTMKEA